MPNITIPYVTLPYCPTNASFPNSFRTGIKSYKSTPSTAKRSRPLDLFSNGTSRNVLYYAIDRGPFQYLTTNYRATDWIYDDDMNQFVNSTLKCEDGFVLDFAPLANKVRTKVRGEAVNLAQAFAEYKQTASFIGDCLGKVVSLSKAIVRKDPKILLPRKGWSKATANRWLEYQYGLGPLIADVTGSIDAIVRAGSTKPIYVKGVVRTETSFREFSIRNVNATLYYGGATAKCWENVDITMKTAYRAKLNTANLFTPLATFGFTNPSQLLYELTPYSFVLDWFINVGDIIASLDNCILIDSIVVRNSYKAEGKGFLLFDHPAIRGSMTKVVTRTSRAAPTAISLLVTPEYKISQSASHVLSGVALLRQLKRDIPRTH